MKLICLLLTHKWGPIYWEPDMLECERCGKVKWKPECTEAVSDLDSIVNDRDWYSPKQRH